MNIADACSSDNLITLEPLPMFKSTLIIPSLVLAFSIWYASPTTYSSCALSFQKDNLTFPDSSANITERTIPTLPSSRWNSLTSLTERILPITSISLPSSSISEIEPIGTGLSCSLMPSNSSNSSIVKFSGLIVIWVLKFVFIEYPLSV